MNVPWAAGQEPREQGIAQNDDVVRARQQVRTYAQQCRLSLVDQTKFITAASELARNTLVYGGGGQMRAGLVERDGRRGVAAVFEDSGPGIPDVELALTDGWTSGGGLGLGLSGARRLVDEFDLDTEAGRGTTVSIVKWAR
ncbi:MULTISPECIES: anti-sigma regulatory factor [Streptomyces]|uniref:anti-sigma regulatory factor n=1 Tax=Streptomyces TaxID=1883 RepID=UPI0004CA09CC|nr:MULTISPECIES: anti-sigma regulatory factor [Streptomyces]NDZ67351.1 anti-sigma regulatory factor [Streptomyces cyaneofuscatus]ONI55296.1 Serine/threonine-protein kinase RsbT [Streptomyces sp. IB2014 011-1]RDV53730.1 anti-sigma regulatory factor [Streptomyces sp. IB2014 011-12]CAD5952471.1 switch protein/serine-threonine kinase; controls the activity of the anxiosome (stressosome) [Streptomyces sp. KY70]CAD5983485.1 switch protein/serine-threonine kinase; controls the activity of the anxioso